MKRLIDLAKNVSPACRLSLVALMWFPNTKTPSNVLEVNLELKVIYGGNLM